jgi:DNA polymerase III subunit delta'
VSEIIGHESQVNAFLTAMRGERPHHGWLFSGAEGLGKASLAMRAARRLLAEAADPALDREGLALSPTHPTAALLDAWSHPDFILIDRLPKDPKVAEKPRADWPEGEERRRSIVTDQVRDLNRRFATHPTFSTRRIVIIDGAETMEVVTANALLKMLEEPPTGTIFVLITHAPGRLLPTIRSRCRLLRFSGLDDAAMTSALRANLPSASAAELEALAKTGDGSPGRAIRLAGLDLAGLTASLDRLSSQGDPQNRERVALAAAMSPKSAQQRFEALLALIPTYMAAMVRMRSGESLAEGLRLWERARDLAAQAIPGSLDPQSVTFTLAGLVAGLAPGAKRAKA